MRDVRVAAAQFEGRDGDKAYNLGRIRELTREAAGRGAEMVCFHECSISNYSFVQPFTLAEMLDLAEEVPTGPSTLALLEIAREFGVAVLAGLFEREAGRVYNTCVAVGPEGVLARHRKLHVFINRHLTPGEAYTRFDYAGCPCGILICYDNNLPENVRATTLLGAELIFMPHVTGGVASTMPGRGTISPDLWANRLRDPIRLRQELDGPKARAWLHRWLPARAWENGVYAVFANQIGLDHGEVRPGGSMVLDPFGEVLAECRELGDEVTLAFCPAEKITLSSGKRYLRSRRPDLYTPLTAPPAEPPVTEPGWAVKYGG
jgi:predicted amidohydrolase